MKKIISILFILLLVPFLVLAQESAPAEPKEESSSPESFFNDLVKTLNPGDSTKKVEEKPEGLPVPEPLPVIQEPVKMETQNESPSVPVPESNIPVPANETVDQNTSLPVDPLEKKTDDLPAPVEQIAPANVATPNIVIGSKDNKKEKVKKEREKAEIVPFIEPPDPKSSAQKKYVSSLEKKSKSRMRLITLDPADHIFSRKFRSPEYALQNPANLGVRAELTNSFSIIPINTLDLDIKTSTKPFVFIDEYLSTGELLTPEREDSMIAMLGPNGLELPVDLNLPTLVNFKMGLLGGSLFANAGLFIQERLRIPGEFFGIILDGATFDNPFIMNEDMGVNINTYLKGSVGYGSFIELPSVLGEIRFGANINTYAGAFASVNITNLELVPSETGVTMQGIAETMGPVDTLNLFGPAGFQFSLVEDYMGIPNFTFGYDLGIGWRIKLNRILPIAPKLLKNYIDVQVGLEDLGASISMNHAYVREVEFGMEMGDLVTTIADGFNIDSMMVLSETVVVDDSTISMPLGAKLNLSVNYQPIPQLMLRAGMSNYLSEGLNSNSGPNYFYGVDIYPISSLCLSGTVTQKGHYRFSEVGVKLYSKSTEFGLKLRVYDLDFSLTENVSGAGLQLNWAKFF